MWDVFKCIKSSPEVPHVIILMYVIIDAPTVYTSMTHTKIVTVKARLLFENMFRFSAKLC